MTQTPVTYSDASGTTATSLPATRPPLSYGWGHVAALGLLLGGGVLAWTLHRRKQDTPAPGNALLSVEATLSMGPGQDLRLVRCGEDLLLLGLTGQQVTVLKTYGPDEQDALQLNVSATSSMQSTSFADVLRHATRPYLPTSA